MEVHRREWRLRRRGICAVALPPRLPPRPHQLTGLEPQPKLRCCNWGCTNRCQFGRLVWCFPARHRVRSARGSASAAAEWFRTGLPPATCSGWRVGPESRWKPGPSGWPLHRSTCIAVATEVLGGRDAAKRPDSPDRRLGSLELWLGTARMPTPPQTDFFGLHVRFPLP